jgi:hypothetical protein
MLFVSSTAGISFGPIIPLLVFTLILNFSKTFSISLIPSTSSGFLST